MTSQARSALNALAWEAGADSVAFWCEPPIELERWAGGTLRTRSGAGAHVGRLLQLADDGVASWNGVRLTVPYHPIAKLSNSQLSGLGLPPICPHVLLVESGKFSISQPEFRIQATFRDSHAHAVRVSSRTGCLAQFDDEQFVLHDPQYSIVEAVDAFNGAASTGGQEQINTRLTNIARLQTLLGFESVPDGPSVGADDYLRGFRVVVPTQFTLALSRSKEGIEIDPELLVSESSHTPGASANDLAVPAARQHDFAQRFRKTNSVRPTYALGGDWFVALPRPIQAALTVVRDVQRSDTQTRARFAAQPREFLRAGLGESLTEDDLEGVFFDGDYGERVSGVGLWQPKVLPWLTPQTQSWLPAEECGLTIGSERITILSEQIPAAREIVASAVRDGAAEATIAGRSVPANAETLEALDALAAAVAPQPMSRGAERLPTSLQQQVVLLIKDNLEDPTYKARTASRAGVKSTPRTLRSALLAHQTRALHWLQDHWLAGTTGALLADDMGLGKTFETLAFVCWVREQMSRGAWARTPVLIVAPTGLLENWRSEINKHVDEDALGNVVLCWGSQLARLRRSPGRDTKDGIPVLDMQELAAADVVLTTYETLRDYQHSFCRVNWSLAIFDEAQKIKNPQTLASRAAQALASKATLSIALTGTPVENRLSDLWTIVDTVQPLRLGSLRRFVEQYEGQGHLVADARRSLRSDLTTASDTTPAVMLRRLKKDHLPGLPRVSIQRFEDPMPPVQAHAYAAAVGRARANADDRGTMLKALHEMRAVSLHPEMTSAQSADELIERSARFARTFDILDTIHGKAEKVLIFVEFHVVQAVLVEVLQQRYGMSAAPFVINGEVPGDRRKHRVEAFQNRDGFDVMLLSPRAGGVGLTLTAANHVIHLGRWWNPAVEDQCTDRVNRIGQTREVHVYFPLAKHPVFGDQSFDLLLDALLERKRAQSEDALTPPDASVEDVNALFNGATGVC
jgi:hypothetical protein